MLSKILKTFAALQPLQHSIGYAHTGTISSDRLINVEDFPKTSLDATAWAIIVSQTIPSTYHEASPTS